MSASSVRAGAAYEAVLVDKVSDKVNQVIHSLERLRAAFERLDGPSKNVARNMDVVGNAMREVRKRSQVTAGSLGRSFSQMAKTVNTAGQAIGQAMIHIGNQVRQLGLILTGTSAAIGAFVFSSVKQFSTAAETLDTFNAVFKENAETADAWARSYSDALGRSTTDTRKAMNTFQAFFTGKGFTGDEASALTKNMVKAADDLAAFRDIDPEEAYRRILGGLRGESENLSGFGFAIQEADLSLTSFADTLGKTSEEMSGFEKVQARVEVIASTMEDIGAAGRAAKEAENFPAQLNRLSAAFKTFKEGIGAVSIGFVSNVVNAITNLFKAFGELTATQVNAIIGFGLALGAIGIALTTLGTVLVVAGPLLLGAATALASLFGAIAFAAAAPLIAAVTAALLGLAGALGLVFAYEGITEFGWADAFEELKLLMSGLAEEVKQSMNAINNALKGEDINAAWEIFKLTGQAAILELAAFLARQLSGAIIGAFVGVLKQLNAIAEGTLDLAAMGNIDAKMARQAAKALGVFTFNDDVINALGATLGGAAQGMINDNINKPLKEAQDRLDKLRADFKLPPRPEWDIDFLTDPGDLPDPRAGGEAEEQKKASQALQDIAKSIVGFAGGFGLGLRGAAAFGPSFDPIETELRAIKRVNEEQLEVDKETNRTLNRALQDEWTFS